MTSWKEFINEQDTQEYMISLKKFINNRYENGVVYPPKEDVYRAFSLTPLGSAKVVLLGQDPYHGPGQAHGLSFSVANPNAVFPPSLGNIFKELKSDLNITRTNPNLTDWAKQGVLLLNTVLTVEEGQADSHAGRGWEIFTDAAIELLSQQERQIIFVLWGLKAQKKIPLLSNPLHKIIKSSHPSPLAAYRGFLGSKPFSQINTLLAETGQKEIQW